MITPSIFQGLLMTHLTRKTICFSKSMHMHDIVIGLFVNRTNLACGFRLVKCKSKTRPVFSALTGNLGHQSPGAYYNYYHQYAPCYSRDPLAAKGVIWITE
jgi:hypothetical protein